MLSCEDLALWRESNDAHSLSTSEVVRPGATASRTCARTSETTDAARLMHATSEAVFSSISSAVFSSSGYRTEQNQNKVDAEAQRGSENYRRGSKNRAPENKLSPAHHPRDQSNRVVQTNEPANQANESKNIKQERLRAVEKFLRISEKKKAEHEQQKEERKRRCAFESSKQPVKNRVSRRQMHVLTKSTTERSLH